MAPLLSYQPFTTLSTILLTACASPYLLTLGLYYIIPRNRPNPNWSFRTAISSAWLHLFFRYATAIQMKPGSRSKYLLGSRYVPVQPGPKEIYTGILENEKIKPAPVAGAWFPKRPPTEEIAECVVVINFQGGFVTATDPGKAGAGPLESWPKLRRDLCMHCGPSTDLRGTKSRDSSRFTRRSDILQLCLGLGCTCGERHHIRRIGRG